MKNAILIQRMGAILVICGIVLTYPFSLAAQETTQKQEGQLGQTSSQRMKEKEHLSGMRAEMRKMHEQMEAMHQEMTQELQEQMAALRKHDKMMAGITDEKQLLKEMKKHLQMTDELLGTMLAQHEKMHAQMKAHEERMRSQWRMKQQTKKAEPEGREMHH